MTVVGVITSDIIENCELGSIIRKKMPNCEIVNHDGIHLIKISKQRINEFRGVCKKLEPQFSYPIYIIEPE